MQTIKFFGFAFLVALQLSCNNDHNSRGHSHDLGAVHNNHDDHEHGDGLVDLTLFSPDYELFVEFPALVSGQTSVFTVHVTELHNHQPLPQGKMTVSLITGNKGIRHTVVAPDSPGIFRPALQPKAAGTYRLLFELADEFGNHVFEITQIEVYANAHDAAHLVTADESLEKITFRKEQAWKTEFETQEVVLRPFYSIIRTSGRVKPHSQSTFTINAQAAGRIALYAVRGETVKKGDLLAMVTGSGLESNFDMQFDESKIAFSKSRADYQRSRPLAESQAISQKDFLEIQSRYLRDSLRYNQKASLVSQKGLKITSPIDGFVSHINVENGVFVENGSSLLTVASSRSVLIETFVNQSDIRKIPGIFDANFKIPGEDAVFSLGEVNGNVVAKNAFINETSTRTSVIFSAENNGKLVPGMFLECFLKTGKKDLALVIPFSAIIEEQGLFYVFVQTGGESYVKRQVHLADNDGVLTEVASGLVGGERIVTKGVVQVKLASMAGTLPLHGHTH